MLIQHIERVQSAAAEMPSNGQFGFSVLVGGKELPEYNHPEDNTRVLVESILWSPVTYWVTVKEYCDVSEEVEVQKWPVTPYEVKVYVEASCRVKYHYRVFVDGTEVGMMWLDRGESKILSGFPEGPEGNGSYREFLFSLPRFANNAKDRVAETRGHKVGKIEVVCFETSFSHVQKLPKKSKSIDFSQANKMDVFDITQKKYTMATTRVGRLLRDGKPYDKPVKTEGGLEDRSIWNIGDEVQKIHVEYHMTQTLMDWGIQPVRPMWPEQDKGEVDLEES